MLKIIITGTTGYVGEGVLLECLKSDKVEKVLSVSRKSTGRKHEKLEELIIPNFKDLPENDERFKGYNACFYCAGKMDIDLVSCRIRIDFHSLVFF